MKQPARYFIAIDQENRACMADTLKELHKEMSDMDMDIKNEDISVYIAQPIEVEEVLVTTSSLEMK